VNKATAKSITKRLKSAKRLADYSDEFFNEPPLDFKVPLTEEVPDPWVALPPPLIRPERKYYLASDF